MVNLYIYNVGAKTFIAGKEATIKDINSAYIWQINGSGSYTFACYNDTQDRINMSKSLRWTASIKEKSGASTFNVIPSTTTTSRGNTYKLSVTSGKDTRYFNVDGKSYSPASTPSNMNDWLFISEPQKKAYTYYQELFNKARDYQKYTLSESLREKLTNTLNATEAGSYDTYTADIENLHKVIADIDTYLKDTPTGINSSSFASRQGYTAIYDINGVRHNTLSKGINIVKMVNGEIRKIIIR